VHLQDASRKGMNRETGRISRTRHWHRQWLTAAVTSIRNYGHCKMCLGSMAMNTVQLVSLVTGIVGAILGSAGLAVSILTYLRDRPRLSVKLQWDMSEVGTEIRMGLVRVANVGRRPAHLAIVALELPKKYRTSHLILNQSIQGKRLDEGDKPEGFIVNYDQLSEYKADWNKIRAMAEDSAGKTYFSEFPKKKPSWAN
jgi:hypothetical protein